mgnify:CR=1 FL=1
MTDRLIDIYNCMLNETTYGKKITSFSDTDDWQ